MTRRGTVCFVVAATAALAMPRMHADQPLHEIQVVARRFAFDPQVINVTAGEPVRLLIRSDDGIHGFAIRELHIDVQIPRGGEAAVEFTAPPAGRYEVACSEFCGNGHAQMKAVLVSTAPARTPH